MTEAPLSAPPARRSRVAAAAAQAPQPLVRVEACVATRSRAHTRAPRCCLCCQALVGPVSRQRLEAHRRGPGRGLSHRRLEAQGSQTRYRGGTPTRSERTRYRGRRQLQGTRPIQGVRQLRRAAGGTPTCSWPRALTLRLVRSASGTIARARRSALTLLLTRSLYLSLAHLRARRSALIPAQPETDSFAKSANHGRPGCSASYPQPSLIYCHHSYPQPSLTSWSHSLYPGGPGVQGSCRGEQGGHSRLHSAHVSLPQAAGRGLVLR